MCIKQTSIGVPPQWVASSQVTYVLMEFRLITYCTNSYRLFFFLITNIYIWIKTFNYVKDVILRVKRNVLRCNGQHNTSNLIQIIKHLKSRILLWHQSQYCSPRNTYMQRFHSNYIRWLSFFDTKWRKL